MAKYYDGAYSGRSAKMAQEKNDAGMLPRDRGVANMPQTMVMRPWPTSGYNMPEGLDDRISGIDRQVKSDMKGKKPINSEKF